MIDQDWTSVISLSVVVPFILISYILEPVILIFTAIFLGIISCWRSRWDRFLAQEGEL